VRFFLIIFYIITYLSVSAQTGNNVITHSNGCFYFDESDELRFKEIGPFIASDRNFIVSKYNGEVLMYQANEVIYNSEGDSLSKMASKRSLESLYINLGDSIFFTFQIGYTLYSSPRISDLFMSKFRLKDGILIADDAIQYKQVLSSNVQHIDVSIDTMGNSWLIVRTTSNTFRALQFGADGSIARDVVSALPQLYIPNYENIFERGDAFVKASAAGNTLAVSTNVVFYDLPNGEPSHGFTHIDLLDFNKENGVLTYKDRVTTLTNSALDINNKQILYRGIDCEFSSSEEYLYYRYDLLLGNSVDNAFVHRFDIDNNNFQEIYTYKYSEESDKWYGFIHPKMLKLFNDGNIYIPHAYRDGTRQEDRRYILDRIENVNLSTSELKRQAFVSQKNKRAYAEFGYSKYNYIRTKPQYNYDCAGHVTFRDKCDYALPNTTVTYFSEDVAGSGVLIPRGQNPNITYTKDGDYLCKVILKSHEGTYKEIHYDTLKIRIPEKPVAAFTAQDTVICAYTTLQFTNQSTTDTVHATNGEKWVWTFGDGTSKTVLSPESKSPVSHSYKTPGTYTVSLFYSNGFCDSTLVKNQYINVVDAPAPGFTVDNIRGCSPFTVHVTDTVTKNTIRKEYNYYDGRGWIDVPVNQANFSQTYPDAGTYWITQRLYGYTGCVTQLDSVQVFVTPGFTAFDTSHITNATYQDIPAYPKAKEIVTLTWPCLEDAAVRYDIYRNAQKIESIVADSVTCIYGNLYYDDSLVNAKTPNTYTVLALDSCGTATQLGRVGQPVHLTGEVVGNNELSIIRYTAYQDWNVGAAELSYDLQTEAVLGDWKTLKQENSTADYRDYQFLDATKAGIQLEKCYRVIARLGGSKSTISNILCLPYSPVIFIPTAYTKL